MRASLFFNAVCGTWVHAGHSSPHSGRPQQERLGVYTTYSLDATPRWVLRRHVRDGAAFDTRQET